MQLRPYQVAMLRSIESAFAAGNRRLIVQVPTGGGKTVLAAELVRRITRRVLYVVPSVEIFGQTDAKLRAVGIVPEMLEAGAWPRLRDQRVVLAMAQTLQRRLVHVHDAPWWPDLIIVDEAHRLLDAHMELLRLFPSPSVALTATPVRLDGRSLAGTWPCLVSGPTVRQLQRAGALCPVHTIEWPIVDLRGTRVRAGDYEQNDLERRLIAGDAHHEAARAWSSYLRGRRSIAFCPGRDLSRKLVRALTAVGARAVHLDGDTPADKRAGALERLRAGQLDVVSNCGLFIEGLDLPSVDGVIVCRPTLSTSLWLQMAGRGMRTAPGKTDLLLIDHGSCSERLGPVDADRDWRADGAARPAAPLEDGQRILESETDLGDPAGSAQKAEPRRLRW
jgi:superfamily II DNA or RNA helicase